MLLLVFFTAFREGVLVSEIPVRLGRIEELKAIESGSKVTTFPPPAAFIAPANLLYLYSFFFLSVYVYFFFHLQ